MADEPISNEADEEARPYFVILPVTDSQGKQLLGQQALIFQPSPWAWRQQPEDQPPAVVLHVGTLLECEARAIMARAILMYILEGRRSRG